KEVSELALTMLIQQLTDWSASHASPTLIFPVRENCLELAYVLHRLQETIPEGSELSLELDERELRDYLDWASENRAEPSIPLGIRNPGTGYLNIQELGTVPLTFLKLGSERCRHLRENPADRSMVQITAGMAHSLNVLCIADGPQTPESATLLLELG
ncbi:MAG: EAL domain-containing protein, partial [Leptospiraceae bacterium]|nr:EAL domain-containing protein [Leptospiraceae bacterium]